MWLILTPFQYPNTLSSDTQHPEAPDAYIEEKVQKGWSIYQIWYNL